MGFCSGISFIDSTPLRVCHNQRINSHKVMAGLAGRGKTSTGWFYGFKLHLVINDQGELLNLCFTPGNVDDRKPVPKLSQQLFGKLVGDKGYISQDLFEQLFGRNLQLITRIKSNMKNRLILLWDKLLLRKRALVETVIDQLKNISQIEHSRHRSVINYFTEIVAGLVSTDIGPVLKSMGDGNGQAMDTMAVDEIRNLLFGNAGDGGEDLIARDVQRGRDNGIGSYNQLRSQLGLAPVTTFAGITSSLAVQAELAAAYPGGVNTIDAFEGGVAEDHAAGSDVGPLFQTILVDQFTRLRDGDRYFYQSQNLNSDEMAMFQSVSTLTRVIEENSDVSNLQADAFVYTVSISGNVSSLLNRLGKGGQSMPAGIGGMTVTLQYASGGVVATTTTDRNGNYQFDQQNGVGTGSYVVSITLPDGTIATRSVSITRGGQVVPAVNFVVSRQRPPLIMALTQDLTGLGIQEVNEFEPTA